MKKYLMLNHGQGGSPEAWKAYFEMLLAGNHLVGGSALGEGLALKKGLFSGAKTRTVSGYIVIQARDLRSAKKILSQSPVHQSGGTVELFPLVKSD